MLRRIRFGLAAAFVSLVAAQLTSPGTASLFNTNSSYTPNTQITVTWFLPDTSGTLQSLKLFKANSPGLDPSTLPTAESDLGDGNIPITDICSDITLCSIIKQSTSFTIRTPNITTTTMGTDITANYFFGLQWLDSKNHLFDYYSKIFILSNSLGGQTAGSGSAELPAPTAIASNAQTPTVPAATSTGQASAVPETSASGGLSTGAKAGIGAGVGAAVVVALVALFVFFRRRKNRTDGSPHGMAYAQAHDADSRDLRAEKEMNVVTSGGLYSPIERQSSFNEVQPVGQPQESYNHQHFEPEQQRNWQEDEGAAYETMPQAHSSVPSSPAFAGTTVAHLQEPGMTAEDIAKLDEEERRIDEAIAEAERRRNNPNS